MLKSYVRIMPSYIILGTTPFYALLLAHFYQLNDVCVVEKVQKRYAGRMNTGLVVRATDFRA